MDPYSGSGSWTMIPTIQTHTNSPAPSNQDHLFLSPQHHQQQFYQQPQFPQQQQFQQQPQLQHRTIQQQQQQQQQNQHHQSLASHFHLLHLVENLADAIENGTRDQHSDALVSEFSNHFEKCQQLLNSISGSISSKAMTVEGQKRKLEECEQLQNQRRELIGKYKNSVEELIKSEP
ncbi:mediator of RNA polymerase II transcription subunit 9-like [Mangifera indica]|uniref:mediator of RNA polymerase II transcription subunit 9-like n=1 Tax=Mangifera indica TaxID=29780 RepID=UPI001CFB0D85|nr:mediator of RNA polymerase II transcription subunit 9-like [Mangifera indica]XP_044495851.1 mediator of RNA polymerase II transcription subunit 9-like [Mangifera indica]